MDVVNKSKLAKSLIIGGFILLSDYLTTGLFSGLFVVLLTRLSGWLVGTRQSLGLSLGVGRCSASRKTGF